MRVFMLANQVADRNHDTTQINKGSYICFIGRIVSCASQLERATWLGAWHAYVSLQSKILVHHKWNIGKSMQGFKVYTMDHGRWPISMVRFQGPISYENQFTKRLGPSLRVNQEEWLCTESECADFFNTCPKRAVLKGKENQVGPFSCLHLLFPNKHFIKK